MSRNLKIEIDSTLTLSEAISLFAKEPLIFQPLGADDKEREETLRGLLSEEIHWRGGNEIWLRQVAKRLVHVRTTYAKEVANLGQGVERELNLWHVVCGYLARIPDSACLHTPKKGEVKVLWLHFGLHLDEAASCVLVSEFLEEYDLNLDTVIYAACHGSDGFTDEEQALLQAMGGLIMGVGGGDLDDHAPRDGKESGSAIAKLLKFDEAYVKDRLSELAQKCASETVPSIEERWRRFKAFVSYVVFNDVGVGSDFGLAEMLKWVVYTEAHTLEITESFRLNVTFTPQNYGLNVQKMLVTLVRNALLSWLLMDNEDPESEFSTLGWIHEKEDNDRAPHDERLDPAFQAVALKVIAAGRSWMPEGGLQTEGVLRQPSVSHLRGALPERDGDWKSKARNELIDEWREAHPRARDIPARIVNERIALRDRQWKMRETLRRLLQRFVRYEDVICGNRVRIQEPSLSLAEKEKSALENHLLEGVYAHEAMDWHGDNPFTLYHLWWRWRQCEGLPDGDPRKVPAGYADETLTRLLEAHLDTQAVFWIGAMQDADDPEMTTWLSPIGKWQGDRKPSMGVMRSGNWKSESAMNWAGRADVTIVHDPVNTLFMLGSNGANTSMTMVDAHLRGVIATLRLLEMRVLGEVPTLGEHYRYRYHVNNAGDRSRYKSFVGGTWSDGTFMLLSKAGRFHARDPWFGAMKDLGFFKVFKGSKFHPETPETALGMRMVIMAYLICWSVSFTGQWATLLDVIHTMLADMTLEGSTPEERREEVVKYYEEEIRRFLETIPLYPHGTSAEDAA